MDMELERTQVAQRDFDLKTKGKYKQTKGKYKKTANPVERETLWSSVDGVDGWTPDMLRGPNGR